MTYWPQLRLSLLLIAVGWIFGRAWIAQAECSGLEHLGEGRTFMVSTDQAVADLGICVPGRAGQLWEGYVNGELVVGGVVTAAEVVTLPDVPRGHPIEFCTEWATDAWDCTDWMLTLDHDSDGDGYVTGFDYAAFRGLLSQGVASFAWDWNTFRSAFGWDRPIEQHPDGRNVWR